MPRAPQTTAPGLLDVPATLAALGGIGRATLYVLIRDGHLTPVKIGRRTMFDPADVRAYVERLKREQADAKAG